LTGADLSVEEDIDSQQGDTCVYWGCEAAGFMVIDLIDPTAHCYSSQDGEQRL
jgi:hypothetical protein